MNSFLELIFEPFLMLFLQYYPFLLSTCLQTQVVYDTASNHVIHWEFEIPEKVNLPVYLLWIGVM